MKFLDYIQGYRKGKEAHRIEHEAMNDPFLYDAIEGFDSVKGNHAHRIARMQASVLARTTMHNSRSGAWKILIAAVVVIALLSGYFALMNHESSMAIAHETESNTYINLYAPQVYIEQKSLELTAMMENDPSQQASIETAIPISNVDDVIKPVEILPLYVPGTYADLKKEEATETSSPATETKKIFIADASSSILAEAKTSVSQSNTSQSSKGQQMPDKLKDAWNTKEVTEVSRSRTVEVNRNTATGKSTQIMTVSESPKTSTTKQTEATSLISVDTQEARILAEQAGFDKVEEVNTKDIDGHALELKDVESTQKTVTRESFYRPKATSSSSFSGSTSSNNRTVPEPLMGQKEYKKYLQTNLIRPQDEDCADVKGKVTLQLSVDKDGNPVNIVVTKALCKSLDKEAVRLVRTGPKWKYGTLRANIEVQF